MWDLRTFAQFWNVSRVVTRLYGWVYKILSLFNITVEDRVVDVTVG